MHLQAYSKYNTQMGIPQRRTRTQLPFMLIYACSLFCTLFGCLHVEHGLFCVFYQLLCHVLGTRCALFTIEIIDSIGYAQHNRPSYRQLQLHNGHPCGCMFACNYLRRLDAPVAAISRLVSHSIQTPTICPQVLWRRFFNLQIFSPHFSQNYSQQADYNVLKRIVIR